MTHMWVSTILHRTPHLLIHIEIYYSKKVKDHFLKHDFEPSFFTTSQWTYFFKMCNDESDIMQELKPLISEMDYSVFEEIHNSFTLVFLEIQYLV